MPPRESNPNHPFVVSKADLLKNYTPLTAAETAALRESDKPPKDTERKDHLTMDQAETIMGHDNFFGPNAIEKAFGITLDAKDIPEIPFTKADLERAKELGQFLVLRVDKAPDGSPLTMPKMHELLQAQFTQSGKGKVLQSTTEAWKLNSEFFTTETPNISWGLTPRDTIPNSTNTNYLEQTRILAEYITQEVFKDQTIPPKYQEAMDEFQSYYNQNFNGKTPQEITTMLNGDTTWKKYAQELSELKINNLARQTPVETLYDILINFQTTGRRILGSKYTWTNRRASDGYLVVVGRFDAVGAGVGRWKPGYAHGNLGVSFSRSR